MKEIKIKKDNHKKKTRQNKINKSTINIRKKSNCERSHTVKIP